MLSRIKVVCAAAALAATGASFGATVNLLTNGSFEAGLTGWALTGSQGTTPVVAINYNSTATYPSSAYGESVPVANSTTLSPDAAGLRAAYFVDDAARNAGLTQSVFLAKGAYRIGFDAYAPGNGYSNPFDAEFSATIAGVTLTDYFVSTRAAQTWVNYSGLANVLSDGFYNVSFLFNAPGQGFAKDVVIDRAFVLASTEAGGTPVNNVPEPGSLALAGLALLGAATARKYGKKA